MIWDLVISRFCSMRRLLRFIKGLYVICLSKLTCDIISLFYDRFPFKEILDLVYLRSRLLQRAFCFRLNQSATDFRIQHLYETCTRRALVIPSPQQFTLQANAINEESLVVEVRRSSANLSIGMKGNVFLVAGPGMDSEAFLTGQPRGSTLAETLMQHNFRVFLTQLTVKEEKNGIAELDQLVNQLEARLEDYHRRCIASHTPLVVIAFSSACTVLRRCLDRLPSHNTLHLAMIIEVAPNSPPVTVCNGISLLQICKYVLGQAMTLLMVRLGVSLLSQQSLKRILQPWLYSRMIHWLSSQFLDDHSNCVDNAELWEEFCQHIDVIQVLGFQYQQHLLTRQQPPPPAPWYRHILTTYPNESNANHEVWQRPWSALLSPAANEVIYRPILEQLHLLCEYSR